MILYSIVPPEIVFQGADKQENIFYFEAEYMGEKVIVARTSDRHYEISRLLSTRPSSYLDPAFQPGRAVDAKDLK
jgi:hypothetical protein